MDIKPISDRMTTKNPRVLVLLLAFAFFLILFAVSSAQPAYATGARSGPQMINPGNGDPPGSGGTFTHNPNTIEGLISEWSTGQNVVGIRVVLTFNGEEATTTDCYGYFKFTLTPAGLPIQPNTRYLITVNGGESDMGTHVCDAAWGQWAQCFCTDSYGNAAKFIHLQAAATVNVPAAAMFSDTKYASTSFSMDQSSSFSNDVSFSVAGSGVSSGYTSSMTIAYTFGGAPTACYTVVEPSYAVTFYDDRVYYTEPPPGVVKTGISGPNLQWAPGTQYQTEYLNPNNLDPQHYILQNISRGTYGEMWYSESNSLTWSVSSGVSFGISYLAFSVQVDLDTTVRVTSGKTVTVSVKIDRQMDDNTTPKELTFMYYSPCIPLANVVGSSLSKPGTGGYELHVWDASGAG